MYFKRNYGRGREMIYVTGDIHGTIDIYKLVDFFSLESQRKSLSKKDYVIICGDAGVVFYLKEDDQKTCDILSSLPVTVLYIDGNHENFDALEDYDIDTWHGGNVHFIRDDIIHLMRGQVFEIEGKTFLLLVERILKISILEESTLIGGLKKFLARKKWKKE